jgi:hypothetical protein
MGTCNFKTSDVFRNFAIGYLDDDDWECLVDEFDRIKDDIIDDNNIYYFDIKLQSGYYDGSILEVIPNKTVGYSYDINELEHPDDIDSGYLGYNLGNWKPNKIYSSQIKRAIKSEINIINKKVLPKLANLLGMKEIRCAGVFSNGEAIYELM